VIVQADGHAQSFLAAYNLADGQQVWKVERGEQPSWSTPVIYQGQGRAELLTNAPRYLRGYNPLTGKELWRFSNSGLIVQAPAPQIGHGMFYFRGGWPGGRPIKALRPGASGDISLAEGDSSNPYHAWTLEKGSPYIPTPLIYGDYLYVCNDRGVLTCFDAKTGAQLYQQRINNQSIGFSASPVAANGKLYLASEDGDVYVLKAGPKYELLAINPMGESLMATPALSDSTIIVRGRNHQQDYVLLFAIK
jgi:outer membrane protein assembly factor BamB